MNVTSFIYELKMLLSSFYNELARGLTVRRSNPSVSEIFRTRPDRPWSTPSLLYNGYRVFTVGKAAGACRWPPNPIFGFWWDLNFLDRFSRNSQISNLIEIRPVGGELFYADGQTW